MSRSDIHSVGRNTTALLRQYGVDTIFGIPGIHNVEMFRDIEDLGINIVLPRHEQGGAFMADGYARASGRPGVCYSISGPGVTNSLTALGQAYSDSVGVMMISSTLSRLHDGKNHSQLHEMRDQQGAVEAVTELCMTADCENDIEEFCARAFSVFKAARPRPAYLQIPIDLMDQEATRDYRPCDLPTPPGVADGDLERAAGALNSSSKTVILVGGGAIDAAEEVQQLSDLLNAAVVSTIAGKGIVPDDNPWSMGACLQQTCTHEFLRNADVVLVIGSELGVREFWCEPPPFNSKVIRIDIDHHALAGAYLSDILILSDARRGIAALLRKIDDSTSGYTHKEIAAARQASRQESLSNQPGYGPLLDALRQGLPKNAILATDMTMPAYFGSQVFDCYQPRTWLHPNGFGTLGYALPAGIGAKFGSPSRPVAVLAGDYGFQYTMQELSVAVQQKLPIPIVLWNNNSLYAIEDSMIQREIPPVAVHCDNPDFCGLANAMHAYAARPKSYSELIAELQQALTRDGPTLIEVDTNEIV